MKNPIKTTFTLLIITLLAACASHKTQYSKTENNWQNLPLPNKPLEHQIFLIGDVAGHEQTGTNNTLQLLQPKLAQAGKNSSIIFLGDDINPTALASNNPSEKREGNLLINHQLDFLKDFSGKTIFIPGNEEWSSVKGGEAWYAKEKWMKSYLGKGVSFIPDNGCSGPEVKELSVTTVMIAIDSQWYLEDWDDKKGINEACEIRTRAMFMIEVMDKIKDNRQKNIILAMHHPLNSNGRYGGHYPAKEHLFPLSPINENLLLPLPGVGTVSAFMNNSIANRQELRHPNYQDLKLQLIDIAEKFTNVIFVSGHEHSLQYFEEEDQHFIVSGAGSSQTPVALGGDALFVAGVQGFSTLKIYEDGEVWVEFWATSHKNGTPLSKSELIFRKKVRSPLPSLEELIPAEFPEYEQLKKQDSITLSVMDKTDLKIHNQLIWGKLYTAEYLTPFKLPIVDLATEKGGLVAIGMGGGNQTNSIRLKSKDGKFYQLRSIEKVTERFPGIVRKTFVNELAKQELTAGNPFSAVVVGDMAAAIDVFHTNPRIVYVPNPTLSH